MLRSFLHLIFQYLQILHILKLNNSTNILRNLLPYLSLYLLTCKCFLVLNFLLQLYSRKKRFKQYNLILKHLLCHSVSFISFSNLYRSKKQVFLQLFHRFIRSKIEQNFQNVKKIPWSMEHRHL